MLTTLHHILFQTRMLSHKSLPAFLNDKYNHSQLVPETRHLSFISKQDEERQSGEKGSVEEHDKHRRLKNDIAWEKIHQQIIRESWSEKDSSVSQVEARFCLKQLLSLKEG